MKKSYIVAVFIAVILVAVVLVFLYVRVEIEQDIVQQDVSPIVKEVVDTSVEVAPSYFESQKEVNSAATMAFLFRGVDDISDKTVPSLCYNGTEASKYEVYTDSSVPTSHKHLVPLLIDLETGKEKVLTSVGFIGAPFGCAQITGWVDEHVLGEQARGVGHISRNEINIKDDSSYRVIETNLGYSLDGSDYHNIKHRVESYLVFQDCPSEHVCGDINIYFDDSPKKMRGSYNYLEMKLVNTIEATKPMTLDIDSEYNREHRGKSVQIGTDSGFIILDLQTGKTL